MNWLNLVTSIWAREEYAGTKLLDRGIWHSLLFYCAIVENGGRISGCKAWPNVKCKEILRLRKREILRKCDLWEFDGDDLVVKFYPWSHEKKKNKTIFESCSAPKSLNGNDAALTHPRGNIR